MFDFQKSGLEVYTSCSVFFYFSIFWGIDFKASRGLIMDITHRVRRGLTISNFEEIDPTE